MRINTIKGFAMSMIMAAAMTFVSCADWDMPHYGAAQPDQTINNFDFSTTSGEITLNVSYAGCGVKTPVFFELYDEEPITWNEEGNGYVMKEDVKALYSAYTDENCVFSGTITLPAYVEKVWVYSPAFFAKTLMEANVVGNTITVSDTEGVTRSARAATRAAEEDGFCYMTRTDAPKEYQAGKRWKEWLGTYDGNGKINYAYTGKDLVPDASVYSTHSDIINVGQLNCPQQYRNASDLEITAPAEVVVTYLGGNTCWNSSLGYYYYKVGQEPKSIEDVNVIMLFPNTQDGKWCKINSADVPKAGVDRMTSVKLKYYPKIAQDSKEGATDIFPAGYKVGLVLATNAWSKRLDYNQNKLEKKYSENRYYRSATSSNLGVRQNTNTTDLPLVASYYTKDEDFVVVSFEDDYKFEDGKGGDQNFSDVVLTIGTNPVATIANLPTLNLWLNADESGYVTLTETLKGTYLFEDLWPQKGDYDMNDACVEYIQGTYKDKWNDTYGETFSFKPRQNFATKKNGIAFRLIGGDRDEVDSKGNKTRKRISGYHIPAEVKLYLGNKDITEQLEYDEENLIFYVIPDTKKNPGLTYTVEFLHIPDGSPQYYERNYKDYKSQIDVFLYRKEGDKNWEVHTKGMEPTPKMNFDYFGKGDDLSKPSEGIYYVRAGNYPYALFLNGHQIDKMSKLFDIENEGFTLDMMYPKYTKWVETEGRENSNWYK